MTDHDDQADEDRPLAAPTPGHLTRRDADFLAKYSGSHREKIERLARLLDDHFELTDRAGVDPMDTDEFMSDDDYDPDQAAERVRECNRGLEAQLAERTQP
jgi:hypothetical protein